MTIIASTLFLTAIALSLFAIFGGIAENIPRILEVIEDRHVAERQPRKITVGVTHNTSLQRPVNVIPMKLRQPIRTATRPITIATRKAHLHRSTASAMRLPVAA